MNLNDLRYVVALARERHFGRAAAACNVSQPTLSVAIKKLEERLGVLLFERTPHEVRLTPVGEQVVQAAQRAIEAADSIRQIALQAQDQLAAPLRIGAIYSIGPYLFPDLITNLRELAPQMPLHVEENFTAVLGEKLRRAELDVVLVALPFDEPGILTLPLYEEPFIVLLPSGHPLTNQEFITDRDLSNETILLLGKGHCLHDQIVEACPSCRPTPESARVYEIEGSSLETIRHMVASGMGVSIFPCTAACVDRYSQRLLAIRRFRPPAPGRVVALAWRATFPRPKVIDVLREAITRTPASCVQLRSRPRAGLGATERASSPGPAAQAPRQSP